MRVSDADRQRVVDELRRHCAAGRLDVDEYASRVAEAMEAASLEDLDRARRDLPMLRIPDPSETAGRGLARAPRGGAGSRPAGGGLLAALVAVASVALVVVAAVVGAVVSWVWAVLLVASWLVGLSQGRFGRRRH